jgi:hypothetical protein
MYDTIIEEYEGRFGRDALAQALGFREADLDNTQAALIQQVRALHTNENNSFK